MVNTSSIMLYSMFFIENIEDYPLILFMYYMQLICLAVNDSPYHPGFYNFPQFTVKYGLANCADPD